MIYVGPVPAWMFYFSPNSTTVCNLTQVQGNPVGCRGQLVDPSGRQAGEYFSRIVSWFTKGYLVDEYGQRHEGGHRFNFTVRPEALSLRKESRRES